MSEQHPLWVAGQPAPYDLFRMPFPEPYLVESTNHPKAKPFIKRGEVVSQELADEINQHQEIGIRFTGHQFEAETRANTIDLLEKNLAVLKAEHAERAGEIARLETELAQAKPEASS